MPDFLPSASYPGIPWNPCAELGKVEFYLIVDLVHPLRVVADKFVRLPSSGVAFPAFLPLAHNEGFNFYVWSTLLLVLCPNSNRIDIYRLCFPHHLDLGDSWLTLQNAGIQSLRAGFTISALVRGLACLFFIFPFSFWLVRSLHALPLRPYRRSSFLETFTDLFLLTSLLLPWRFFLNRPLALCLHFLPGFIQARWDWGSRLLVYYRRSAV